MAPFPLVLCPLGGIYLKGVNLWPKTKPLTVRTAVRTSSIHPESKNSTRNVVSVNQFDVNLAAMPARRNAEAARPVARRVAVAFAGRTDGRR